MSAQPNGEAVLIRMELWIDGCGDQRQIGEQLHDLGYRAGTHQRNTQRAEGRQLGLPGEREAEQGCLVDVKIGVDLAKPPQWGLDVTPDQGGFVSTFTRHDVTKPRDDVGAERVALEHLHERQRRHTRIVEVHQPAPLSRNHKYLTPANIAAAAVLDETFTKSPSTNL